FHRDLSEPLWTTKPLESGTGLGLAIVSGTLDQYGGSIAVESDVGAGTRFTAALPVAKQRRIDASATERLPFRPSVSPPFRGDRAPSLLRILLATLAKRAPLLSAAEEEKAMNPLLGY